MIKIFKWSGNWVFESDARDRKSLSKSYFDSCINVFKMNLNDSERNFAKTTLEWPISAHFWPFQAISGEFRSFSLSIWRNVHERSSKCQCYKKSYQALFWMPFWLDFATVYMEHFEHQNSICDFPICFHLQIDASAHANPVQMSSLLIQNHRHDFHNEVALPGVASVCQACQFELNQNHAEAGEGLIWIVLINVKG